MAGGKSAVPATVAEGIGEALRAVVSCQQAPDAGHFAGPLREIQMKLLDPVGTVVELWDIKGAFITEANFGELTYEDGGPAEISLTLRFDNAVLQF